MNNDTTNPKSQQINISPPPHMPKGAVWPLPSEHSGKFLEVLQAFYPRIEFGSHVEMVEAFLRAQDQQDMMLMPFQLILNDALHRTQSPLRQQFLFVLSRLFWLDETGNICFAGVEFVDSVLPPPMGKMYGHLVADALIAMQMHRVKDGEKEAAAQKPASHIILPN